MTYSELIYIFSEEKDYTDFDFLNDIDLLEMYDLYCRKKISFNLFSTICFYSEFLSREFIIVKLFKEPVFKFLSIKDVITIANFKKKYPELSEDALMREFEAQYPAIFNKILDYKDYVLQKELSK